MGKDLRKMVIEILEITMDQEHGGALDFSKGEMTRSNDGDLTHLTYLTYLTLSSLPCIFYSAYWKMRQMRQMRQEKS